MVENVFTWRGFGGDWNDPTNWTYGVYNGPGQYVATDDYQLSGTQIATRAPGADDTVVFAYGPIPDAEHDYQNGWTPINGGQPSGGGSAARLLTRPDWSPIVLTGTGTEHYQFGSIELNDRMLSINGATLDTQKTLLDTTSVLLVDQAATAIDAYGRTYSASLGDVTLLGHDWRGTLVLGSHNVNVTSVDGDFTRHDLELLNPSSGASRFGVYGTGNLYFPTSMTVGSGPDTLTLKVSQDYYLDDVRYTVSVDGHQIGETRIASALHSAGADDTLYVQGDFGSGHHTVTVNFLNDAWGGTVETDRNLYVDSITLNGHAVPNSSGVLFTQGPHDFAFDQTPSSIKTDIGTGSDFIYLSISQDAYQGDAQYTVSVDGKQIGGILTAGAIAGSGENDTVILRSDWAPGHHTVAVNFLNDAWGGTAQTDRNLHVDSITFNGTPLSNDPVVLHTAGPHTFSFTDTSVPPPLNHTYGSGTDSLVLKISQDAYQGDAQYTVSVDGKQIDGILTAGAIAGTGENDTVTLRGDWGPGHHTVTVNFLNDAWGGTAQTDRNLHVDSITFNGTPLSNDPVVLYTAGPYNVSFTDSSVPPPLNHTYGSGTDSLVLKVSQDAYQGDAQYSIRVDGVAVDGVQTASAYHSSGQGDIITVKGNYAAGPHTVTVTFLNDLWNGTAETDRNLYVDSITLNDHAVTNSSAALMSNGSHDFMFNA